MKKTLIMSSAVILMVISLTVGLSFAGNERGNGTGICNNIGDPVCDICAGDTFKYTGAVVSMVRGQGIVIATEDEDNITIYGIGPIRYWVSQGVERPVIGDTIKVDGHTVDYNGVVRNIATSIVVEDVTVELRDSETCAPLWQRYNRNRLMR
ncbi:MAG: hypothetical protein LWW98_04700 [Deltaproteobacteria bacterium]|nr:hypothetical protein [Deltaproteobacteria bacterium]